MELLPIFYAGGFFLVACCASALCSLHAGLRPYAKQAFLAPLAFGACSYIGFFLILLSLNSLPLTERLLEGQFQPVAYAFAYAIPGLIGGWLSLKALKSFRA